MKALPAFKLLLLIALVLGMHVLPGPAHAHPTLNPANAAIETARTAQTSGVPETSSVVLIGALGVMLMLRRRRMHA